MISRARLRANRANGKRSKGPLTKEGKERSSRNAVKHGLRAKKFAPGFNNAQRIAIISGWLDRKADGELLSVANEIVDAQIALKSIYRVWDQMLASFQDETVPKNERVKLIGKLKTLSFYAHRASIRQSKAVKRYEGSLSLFNNTNQK